MGQLRIEPRPGVGVPPEEYKALKAALLEAERVSEESHIFWDLDEEEVPSEAKKALKYVADKEGINVTISQVRGTRTLHFRFGSRTSTRMSAEESNARIMDYLTKAKGPVKKGQIIKETGVSPSTCHARINDLIKEGRVIRTGQHRRARYTLSD